MKKESNVPMTQYICNFENKAEQLEEAGITVPSDLLSIMLLSSLPTEYENFCVAMEARDEVLNIESLKSKLIEEEARQNERNNNGSNYEINNNNALFAKGKYSYNKNRRPNMKEEENKPVSRKYVIKCYNCGKPGHKANECKFKSKRIQSNKAEDAMPAMVLNTEFDESDFWCLDSGATKHMCNDKHRFASLNDNVCNNVYTATEHHIKSAGVGEIKMNVKLYNESVNNIKLQNAMYVPQLRANLMSVSSITDNNYTVTFRKDAAIVKRQDGSTALTAHRRGQLYVVDESEQQAMMVEKLKENNMMRWHQRYGHLNVNDLKKLNAQDMVVGMQLDANAGNFQCEICDTCKIHQQPYKNSGQRVDEILGLVHSDICGPFNVQSLGGARYFVTFIDDCTRYIEVVTLRNRSDVLTAFKNYKRRVEKETGHCIKRLRTDNAKEYLAKDFTKFLEDEGVSRQLSVEYIPQQNGVAERANRTLVEMARCILLQAKLPMSLWGEVINAAVYLRNRCPTKILYNKTPMEMWTNKKPYVGYIRIIGSKVIALDKRNKRSKLEPKGKVYILVGYSTESKAYRLWRPNTKTVIKARDVRFIEDVKQGVKDDTNDSFTYPLNVVESDKEMEPENIQTIEEIRDSESDENMIERSTSEGDVDTNRSRRGPGRPRRIMTGKPGRPRKEYQQRFQESTDETLPDPLGVTEALSRHDRQL